jgi:hypothetical protein
MSDSISHTDLNQVERSDDKLKLNKNDDYIDEVYILH